MYPLCGCALLWSVQSLQTLSLTPLPPPSIFCWLHFRATCTLGTQGGTLIHKSLLQGF
jgi:hypothetical protein